ncbi:MAG TPA: hypothetical protein VHC49_07790 [Mycobacteriales bacterium]|nr:hypothetical protein [Mycobacteriales bacterium]
MRGTSSLRRLGTLTLGVGLVCALAAGCGGGDKTLSGPKDDDTTTAPDSTAPSSSAPPSSSTPTGSTAITGDPRSPITWHVRQPGGSADVAAVLHSYQAYLKATTQLKGKPTTSSPLFAQVSTGVAQTQLTDSVRALADDQHELYGPITAYPEVTDADAAGGTATVLDCPDFSHFLIDGKASGATQRYRPLKATLSNSSGSWKVDTYTKTDMRACVGVQ